VSAAKSSTGIATTDTAETAPQRARVLPQSDYVGRFAPSPTGDLHFGSLYTAAASFLDARAHGGRWLVRMEDVDRTREIAGAATRILETLELFGFEWDGEVMRQSERDAEYAQALALLASRDLTFECSCSRLMLADEERYPGHCRRHGAKPGAATAIRLKVDPREIEFTDRIQGVFRQNVSEVVGDLILRRRDRLFSYLLAVVVDDAAQGVTHVVRGADLLDNTPRQIYLQESLGLPTPHYAHVPLLIEASGEKLAKSARSVGIAGERAMSQLLHIFTLLGLNPPSALGDAGIEAAWTWARTVWSLSRVPSARELRLDHSAETPTAT
jgi:glutamyl-Q tRNA(Asp) synthetase